MDTGLARNTSAQGNPEEFEQLELRGFARSIAEIDWLLLILVMLYFVAPGAQIQSRPGVVTAMIAFAVFVLGFHYVNANARHSRWKLAIESWVMIVFISWVVWNTGGVASPLINLYVLVIITTALTLGKLVSLLEIVLIGTFYFYMAMRGDLGFTYNEFVQSMLYFSPFVLVAYITTLLASDIHHSKAALRTLAETDALTGLLNKRSFQFLYKTVVDKVLMLNQPLTVMMMDIDTLKQVNDRYGHLAGDVLIATVARTIAGALRATDLVCRYGGDEFVVVLPGMPGGKALLTGERLRKAVSNTSFDVDGQAITSTISIGIATWPDHVQDIHTLLAKADASLYACKRSGGNMVLHHGDEADPYQPVQQASG